MCKQTAKRGFLDLCLDKFTDLDIVTAHAHEQVALGTGGKRIFRSFGIAVYEQPQLPALISCLLFSNDFILRLEQALEAALLILRRSVILLGGCGRARARRIQEGKQQIKPGILHQLQGLLEILVRFARETDDNIA